MRKIVCDKCHYEAIDPPGPKARTFHKVELCVDATHSRSVKLVEKEWCENCVETALGELPNPDPYAPSPQKSEELFDALVQAVGERVRDES